MDSDIFKNLERLLADNTVIDVGHYSPISKPDETDIYLWNLGISLYKKAKEKFKNIGLVLLVDDMYKADGELRKDIDITNLPEEYQKIIDDNNVNKTEIIFISQNNLRNSGWLYIRRHKDDIKNSKKFTKVVSDSKGNINQVYINTDDLTLPLIEQDTSGKPPIVRCNLIVANHIKGKEEKGFTNSINLYNVRNTETGYRIERGTMVAKKLFGTSIKAHNFYFENKKIVGNKNNK